MLVGHIKDVEKEKPELEGVKGVYIQWLLAKKEGMKHFYMRYITIEPEGIMPLHQHEVIHEMFIVRGNGTAFTETEEYPIGPGNFEYVPQNEIHGIKNTGNENLEFICCINVPEEDR